MRVNPVYLEITSFAVGEHYYGCLSHKGSKGVRLEYSLTASEARYLNKKDGWGGYRAGSTTERFNSEDDVINLAKDTYKVHFPEANVLVLGSPCVLEPQLILDGPEDLKEQVNKLVLRANKVGYWEEGNEEEMTLICKEWEKLWKGNLQNG